MMKTMKKWWFYITVPVLLIAAIAIIPSAKGIKPCIDSSKEKNCYLFYGIAQNDIKMEGERLKVNFLVKGFPYRRHSVYVEIIMPDGEIDFLYSEEHTKSHKAHYHPNAGLTRYTASYSIPMKKLGPGKYKLRVRFEFDTPGWGRLNRDVLTSNDVKFEIK